MPAVEKTAESLDCDVVIVGAGGAGLTAAAQAAENGAKVIVVEKMPIVGGNSLKATGGMNAADTKYQEALGITDSGVDEFIEDTMNGGHQINDRSLVTVMAEESSDAVELAGFYRCSAAQSRCNGWQPPTNICMSRKMEVRLAAIWLKS